MTDLHKNILEELTSTRIKRMEELLNEPNDSATFQFRIESEPDLICTLTISKSKE